jgi:hypothetical protein
MMNLRTHSDRLLAIFGRMFRHMISRLVHHLIPLAMSEFLLESIERRRKTRK